MTVIQCPHGCGGMVNTAIDNYCKSCRRGLNEQEFTVAESAGEYTLDSPVARKASWCWEWFGPLHHRMRCRLSKGHTGPHNPHEDREPDSVIISMDGELIP